MFVLTGIKSGNPGVPETGDHDYKPAQRLAHQISSLAINDADAEMILGLAKRLSSIP